MVVYKVFLPVASPGLALVGAGVAAATHSASSIVELAAIVSGLVVIAVAGVFTIRSNVGKIWREEAEGEKARVEKLREQLADLAKEATQTTERLKVEWASEVAQMKIDWAAEVAKCQHDTTAEREAKERALADLAAANARTDMTPVMTALERLLTLATPAATDR